MTGRYKPLYDQDYESAAREWIANLLAWESGVDVLPDGNNIAGSREYCRYYWEYAGDPPDAEYCRPAWTVEEATHYQIYETVSEGTPVSPVFETLPALIAWLANEAGYSQRAAEEFVKTGWAMSAAFVVRPDGSGTYASDIESLALLPPKEQ
jgi:hypothetical protein